VIATSEHASLLNSIAVAKPAYTQSLNRMLRHIAKYPKAFGLLHAEIFPLNIDVKNMTRQQIFSGFNTVWELPDEGSWEEVYSALHLAFGKRFSYDPETGGMSVGTEMLSVIRKSDYVQTRAYRIHLECEVEQDV
jgi:hypothetical protein